MEMVQLSIQPEATGRRIKEMIRRSGYTVRDIQSAMGFENPQAVYKWMSGKSMPSLDNIIILSHVLHMPIEELLVIDGEFIFGLTIYFRGRLHRIWNT